MAPLLDIRDLETEFHTRRGVVHAVHGTSFTLEPGEFAGIVGETGCGKSVTVRSIIGLVPHPGHVVGGQVLFEGEDLRRKSAKELRRLRGSKIGFVAQNPFGALNPILSIEEQFRTMIRAHRKASRAEARTMSLAMLQSVGIAGPERVLSGYAHELSGGMAQRVVISMALILNPRLVIADEPTTALDVTVQRQILDLLRRLVSEHHSSMLLVTHDLGVVARYCAKVVVMYAGKVVESGPVGEVFRNPYHPYTQALLGAVPRPGRTLVSLRGTIPSLIDYPSGCPFRDRCDYAFDRCAVDEPLLREAAPGRELACHLEKGVSESVARAS
jgi:oligopeptide/dipeptide ABC transporter ATP-binding protein